jgi:hypothetical protein
MTEHTIQEFKMNLSYESWTDIFNISDDVNLMFNSFINTYIRIFNQSFPYKKYTSKLTNQKWITNGIKVSCVHKRKLYMLSRNTDNPEIAIYYKKYCKVLYAVIKLAKK